MSATPTAGGWTTSSPAARSLETLQREWPLEPADANYFGEVAERWRYADGAGEIGVITSVTQPFCGTCTRARLSATASCSPASSPAPATTSARSCAAARRTTSLLPRSRDVWRARDDRYSEIRSEATVGLPRVEMSRIGG